jgi:hypothetical protein
MRKSWYRNEIEAINRTYGMPTFFMTVNPADLKSPIAKILSGVEACAATEAVLTGNGIFTSSDDERMFNEFHRHHSSANPVACAEYFHRIMNIITRSLLGFRNSQFQTSIFGKLNAYYGVVEQQQRKTLHCHMLIWVQGFESYDEYHNRMATERTYHENFITYINSLIRCSLNNDITGISQKNPASFALNEKSDIQVLENELDYNTEWVVRRCQVHKCSVYHCKKGNRRCRYNFPIKRCSETTYDKITGVITFSRNHNWVNHYNP